MFINKKKQTFTKHKTYDIMIKVAAKVGWPVDLSPLHHHMDPSWTRFTQIPSWHDSAARHSFAINKPHGNIKKGLCAPSAVRALTEVVAAVCWLAVVVSGANGHTLCTHHDRWVGGGRVMLMMKKKKQQKRRRTRTKKSHDNMQLGWRCHGGGARHELCTLLAATYNTRTWWWTWERAGVLGVKNEVFRWFLWGFCVASFFSCGWRVEEGLKTLDNTAIFLGFRMLRKSEKPSSGF